MKTPLSQGKFAVVDRADYEWLSQWKWCLHSGGYAVRNEGGRTLLMHAEICGTPRGLKTDHINRNKLDNRRSNLRIVNDYQNCCNSGLRSDNTTGCKGVYFDKSRQKFCAEIQVNGIKKYLGRFNTRMQAAKRYIEASVDFHGEFSVFQGGCH